MAELNKWYDMGRGLRARFRLEKATADPVVEQATAAPGEQRDLVCRHRYIGWEPGVGHVCRGCYAPVTVTVK